jgi:hypothetical protein
MKPVTGKVVSPATTTVSAVMDSGLSGVASYRLYGLDGVKKVASAEWIEADGDEAAIEVAKEMMDGHDCELWQGPRLVARIERRRDRERLN